MKNSTNPLGIFMINLKYLGVLMTLILIIYLIHLYLFLFYQH
jgi:hypothetical protein